VMTHEFAFWARRSISHLVWAGVFERHPSLNFYITETTMEWVQSFAEGLDFQLRAYRERDAERARTPEEVKQTSEKLSWMTMKPSDYIQRACYWGASAASPAEIALRHEIGVDRIMWGT